MLRVRDQVPEVGILANGDLDGATALLCCIEGVQEGMAYDLPVDVVTEVRYAIVFG